MEVPLFLKTLTLTMLERRKDQAAIYDPSRDPTQDLAKLLPRHMQQGRTGPYATKLPYKLRLLYGRLKNFAATELTSMDRKLYHRLKPGRLIPLLLESPQVAAGTAAQVQDPCRWLQMLSKPLAGARHVDIERAINESLMLSLVVAERRS